MSKFFGGGLKHVSEKGPGGSGPAISIRDQIHQELSAGEQILWNCVSYVVLDVSTGVCLVKQ